MMFAALMLLTFCLMEFVAYVAHRILFHGPLWSLHRSHHEPRRSGIELNDVFGPFFAVIAIILIGGYADPSAIEITRPIGAGMTLYGAVYFFVHDMYTHRRFWRFDLPGSWLSEMRRAHRHHHSSISKKGLEPYGFVLFQTYERKNRSLQLTVLLIALLASFTAMNSCTALAKKIIQEPKVTLAHVGVKDVGLNGATLLVGVQVDNPNPFNLRVDALRYDVELGGKLLSSSELPGAADVPAHGTQIVEIPVPVKFQDLYASALDFFSKSSSSYRIKGEARFGLLKVPFDQSGDLKLR
jgi:beta-carotene 3-hydroxylase